MLFLYMYLHCPTVLSASAFGDGIVIIVEAKDVGGPVAKTGASGARTDRNLIRLESIIGSFYLAGC
jgi:hypothetical protein